MRALFGTDPYTSDLPEVAPARRDARARMAISLLASVATVALSAVEAQMVLFGMSVVYALGMRRFRVLLTVWGLVLLMFLFASACSWGVSCLFPAIPFEAKGLLIPFLRAGGMVNVVLPLALTTRLQDLFTVLKGLHLPFCIVIPAVVMLRFIPNFFSDIRQVGENVKIRGYGMSLGWVVCHPRLMLRLLLVPLLFRSLRTSEELGIAAELKGLAPGCIPTSYRRPQWKAADTALLAAALAVVAAAVWCQVAAGVPFWGGGMR